MINAYIAVKRTVAEQVRDLARSCRDKLRDGITPTNNERKALKVLRELVGGESVSATIGGDVWVLFNIHVTPEELAALDDVIPGGVVAGAWNKDGTQYGVTRTFVDSGGSNPTIVNVGTPVYPIHPRLIDFMPDLSVGVRPQSNLQLTQIAGWCTREYD